MSNPAIANVTPLDSLFAYGEPQRQKDALNQIQSPLEGELLAAVLVVSLFAQDASVRKVGKSVLAAHAPPALQARLAGDKRNYATIEDGKKLAKVLEEFIAVGLDRQALAVSVVRYAAAGEMAMSTAMGGTISMPEGPLQAALIVMNGDNRAVFAALNTMQRIQLEVKKTLPAGLGALTSLQALVLRGSLTSDLHMAELAQLPSPIGILFETKNPLINYLLPAKSNISGIYFHAEKTLGDITLLQQFPRLESLRISSSSVTDISPLKHHRLTQLYIDAVQLTSLDALAGMTSLAHLSASHLSAPLMPLATCTALKYLDISFHKKGVEDLSFLRPLTQLEHLRISGTRIHQFDWQDLVGKPLQSLIMNAVPDLSPLLEMASLKELSVVGVKPEHQPALQRLKAKRPDISLRTN